MLKIASGLCETKPNQLYGVNRGPRWPDGRLALPHEIPEAKFGKMTETRIGFQKAVCNFSDIFIPQNMPF